MQDLRASPGGLSGRWIPQDVPPELILTKVAPRREKRTRGAYIIYGSGSNSCGEVGLSTTVKFASIPSYVAWPGLLNGVAAAAAGDPNTLQTSP